MIPLVDLQRQFRVLESSIRDRINRVLEHGQYVMGPEVAELEERLAAYVGVNHCITASSGTDTLLIAMMALGIGHGDEVITTPFTFISTGEMIALLGATPVFVDIDPRTYNLNPLKIEEAIGNRTKAIMPVSLYGQCADFDAINAIAARYALPVIEDAAQSFGATYKGRSSCGLSTIGSTSFFPSKPLGAYGDGGAVVTNDNELAKVMREIRSHGQERRYRHSRIGINGRLDTLQAAVLLAKLDRFDWEIERRTEIGAWYSKKIREQCPQAVTPEIEPWNRSVYAQYTVQIDRRDIIADMLSDAGIPSAVHYPTPLHLQPAFAKVNRPSCALPVAERVATRVLSLPMGPDLTKEDQDRVVAVLSESIRNLERSGS